MYYRIFNELDARLLERNNVANQDIVARVKEIIDTLGQAYGYNRGSKDMGGYVLLFDSHCDYLKNIEEILAYYKLDSDLDEYQDVIVCVNSNEEKTEWIERLFMLSSDDALVLIYPEEERKG